jgi:hypothetical protein
LSAPAAAALDIELRAQIMVATFHQAGEEWMPSLSLLLDLAHAQNILGAWMGVESGAVIATLIDPALGTRFDRPALRVLAADILAAVANSPAALETWARLYMVVGILPPDADVAELLRTQLGHVDLPMMVRNAPAVATYALHTLAHVAYTLDDPTLAHIAQEHLGPLARSLQAAEEALDHPLLGVTPAERARILRYTMVDTALHIAVAAYPSQDVIRELMSLLTMLLDADPAMAEVCQPFLHELCQTLPLEQARACWPVMIQARAMK